MKLEYFVFLYIGLYIYINNYSQCGRTYMVPKVKDIFRYICQVHCIMCQWIMIHTQNKNLYMKNVKVLQSFMNTHTIFRISVQSFIFLCNLSFIIHESLPQVINILISLKYYKKFRERSFCERSQRKNTTVHSKKKFMFLKFQV